MHRHLLLVTACACLGTGAACKDDRSNVEKARGEARREPLAREKPQSESAPSPDYPTASSAGTKELFFLEEPDRGEHITKVVIPTGGKTIMKRGFCEMDEHDVVCVPGAGRFRVRAVGATRVVEELRSGTVENTYVVEMNGKGEREQIARVDEYGDVVWVRSYRNGGATYASRALDGSNTLDGCGSRTLELDAQGRATSVTCLQWNGSPMLDASGVARTSLARDARGMVERIEFSGVDGEAIERHDGVHAMVYERTPEGPIRRIDNLGLDKTRALSTRSGCASEEFSFDSEGREISRTCLDSKGGVADGLEGIARTVTKRDANGCPVAETFFNAAGEPWPGRRGGYEQRFVVNERCEVLEESCHGVAGNPMRCEQGVARRTYEYDASGWVTSIKHFDSDNSPARAPGLNRFELRYKYDALGNQTERACFDAAKEPVECAGTGAHAFVQTYDRAGRKVETRYLDPSRKPTKSLGTSVSRSVYDNYDHISQVFEEDEEGNLISSNGMSKRRYLYDRGHQVFGVLLYDAEGNPARYRACFVGLDCPSAAWHALRVKRSKTGEVTKNVFFDAAKQEVGTLDCATEGCWND